jgi:hypothetical protein
VIRTLLKMLDFLFAVEHLPAMDAENFTVGFSLDDF